ncbi:MAG: GNAT family N-acetyltransferase [Desulfobacteraceae bacterium]|nr:GNAT family N-acetyltransferase [Desulfobacteraceae bacterium]
MEIIRLEMKNILQIRPLWDELNRLHAKQSAHFKEYFESFTFDMRLKQFIDRDALAVFVARDETGLIGYCVASVKKKTGEIESIFILPDYRKKDLGQRMMEQAESWLKTKKIAKIQLCVAEGNESAFGFYEKQSYNQRYTVFEKSV